MGAFVQKFTAENAAAQASGIGLATASTAVTGGNCLTVFVGYHNDLARPEAETVTDGVNTYVEQTPFTNDTGSNWFVKTFVAKNITGGTRAVTFVTADGNNLRAITVVETSGADTTSPIDNKQGNFQATPGTGANGVTSGTALASTAPGIAVSLSADTGGNIVAPAAGTGMTDQGTAWTTTTAPSRVVTKVYASGTQQTLYTAANNVGHSTKIVLLLDASSGTATRYPLRSPFKPCQPNLYFPYRKIPPGQPAAPAQVQAGQPWFLWPQVEAQPEIPEEDIRRQRHANLYFSIVSLTPVTLTYSIEAVDLALNEIPEEDRRRVHPFQPFRQYAAQATAGAPWYLWAPQDRIESEEDITRGPNQQLLHRYRQAFQTVGQSYRLWQKTKIDWDIEVQDAKTNHNLLHRYRFAFQTVGQSWQCWVKPPARIEDEPSAPAKLADLTPFRATTPTVQPGQPWFMFPAAEPDLMVEPDAVRTDHAAALYPFRPHDATEPVIVIVSPEPAGSVPGWVPDSEGRLHGPYKRKDQVFGEAFPLSPDLGAQLSITPAAAPPLLLRISEGIDAFTSIESLPQVSDAEIVAAFALWAMMESDGR